MVITSLHVLSWRITLINSFFFVFPHCLSALSSGECSHRKYSRRKEFPLASLCCLKSHFRQESLLRDKGNAFALDFTVARTVRYLSSHDLVITLNKVKPEWECEELKRTEEKRAERFWSKKKEANSGRTEYTGILYQIVEKHLILIEELS